jgi:hypothetical protein
MRRPVLLVSALAVALALSLAACASGGGGSSASSADGGAPRSVGEAPLATGAGSSGGGTDESKRSSTDRSIVVTGELTVTATDPVRAADRAVTIVTAAGGRVDGRSEQAGSAGRAGSATLTLRIPARHLDATLASLKRLGHTDRVTTESSDVTDQTQDLDARITALRTTIQRLLELERRATGTADLIKIETSIGDRQADLESLEAQQRGLADQVAMSTITMTLRPVGTVVASNPAGFGDGLATGWSGFVAFWGGALIALGVALPWLLLLVVLAAIAVGVVVLVRRRERRQGLRPTRG